MQFKKSKSDSKVKLIEILEVNDEKSIGKWTGMDEYSPFDLENARISFHDKVACFS